MHQEVRKHALRLLARRPHFAAELRQKLQRRFPGQLVERVVEELRAQGWLDDRRTAQWALEEWLRKGKGALWIAQALRKRGAPREVREEVERAARAREAEALQASRPKWPEEREKLVRFLRSRGFTDRRIREALAQTGGGSDDAALDPVIAPPGGELDLVLDEGEEMENYPPEGA